MNNILPIVIVGRNRTLMTIEVIKSLNRFIKQEKHFIYVSDRSYDGHCDCIKQSLYENDITNIDIYTTNDKHYSLGGAMNIGLDHAFKISDVVYLSENDFIPITNIDTVRYVNLLRNSDAANISFKWCNDEANIDTVGYMFNNHWYIKTKSKPSGLSYVIDIGCQMLHKRFYDLFGEYTENCSTGITEYNIVKKYCSLSYSDICKNRLNRVYDTIYMRTSNLSINSPIYHIGINSLHSSVKWDCPDEFVYLSNENNDILACQKYLK